MEIPLKRNQGIFKHYCSFRLMVVFVSQSVRQRIDIGRRTTGIPAVAVHNVCHLLCQLSGWKATGVDKISSKIIKISAPIISSSLTYIFNQAITLCTFPNEWKIARVMSLFKSGKRNLPGNYRPISVLPVISKVMERIIYTQLYDYLTTNKLLSEHHFGFRKYHSTATALLDCTNSWYINMDRKLFNL